VPNQLPLLHLPLLHLPLLHLPLALPSLEPL